jgi:hypothetical protein
LEVVGDVKTPDFFCVRWYDYGSRFYDAALSRFTTIDPKAELFSPQSPYVYAANDPICFQEKDGENPIAGALIGGVVGGVVGGVAAWVNGESIKNGMISGAIGGAVAGAIVGSFGTLTGPALMAAGAIGGAVDAGLANASMQTLNNMSGGQSFGDAVSNVDLNQVSSATSVGMMTGGAIAPVAGAASRSITGSNQNMKAILIDNGVEAYKNFERTGVSSHLEIMNHNFKGAARLQAIDNVMGTKLNVVATAATSTGIAIGTTNSNTNTTIIKDFDNNYFYYSRTTIVNGNSSTTTVTSDNYDDFMNNIPGGTGGAIQINASRYMWDEEYRKEVDNDNSGRIY